jgi:hypothetical protein
MSGSSSALLLDTTWRPFQMTFTGGPLATRSTTRPLKAP